MTSKTPQRLCLIDGTYELFRAFYGAPSRKASNDIEISATLSLGRSLRNLAQSGEFTHFAVAFDTVIESFRNRLFDGYKTGEGIDPQLFAQFPLAERMAKAQGFCVLSMVEFEADDGIASSAAQFADEVQEVVIASPDKDLMQCVNAKTVVWDRMREKTYDERGVKEKMGVAPRSIPDFLALVGDSADGIPGVPRWGARSAATVLSHYQHLEQIPRIAADWQIKVRGHQALVEQLKTHEEQVLLYRRLATLREDVPLGKSLADMAFQGDEPELLEELETEWGRKIAR